MVDEYQPEEHSETAPCDGELLNPPHMHDPQPPSPTADDAELVEPGGVIDFFRERVIFITGATGFMGLVLLEKLLRSCRVSKIYLLMRPKRGKDINQRLTEMLSDPLFEQVREKVSKLQEVVEPLEGDCALPDLGLSDTDRQTLLEQVNIVFHVAASVRFDEPLRIATAINVRGTSDVIKLAKEMRDFKALVHVSTAYAHCHRKDIGESFYRPALQAEQLHSLVKALPDDKIENIMPVLLDKWPNTYTFTKAIAEETVRQKAKGMPVAVIRPAMVMCTASEPVRGWVNNLNGPAGVVAGAGLGILRTLNCDGSLLADLVPADMVINATIVAAWEAHRRHLAHSKPARTIEAAASEAETSASAEEAKPTTEVSNPDEPLPSDLPVFNYVSSVQNPITWKHFMWLNEKGGPQWASFHVQWYYVLFLTRFAWIHSIQKVLLHLLPALIVDICAFLIGRKPMLLKSYRKIHKFTDVIAYFCTRSWKFSDTEMQRLWLSLSSNEQAIFPFSIAQLNWEDAVAGFIPGMRQYLVKDPFETLPAARKYYQRLKLAHYCLVTCLWLLLIRITWVLVRAFL